LGSQQPHLADVLQEQLQRVGRHVRLEVQRRFRFAPAALVRRALYLRGRCGRRVDLLDELDLRFL
jgi:transcriptional regulator with AAA-type ATPase domain